MGSFLFYSNSKLFKTIAPAEVLLSKAERSYLVQGAIQLLNSLTKTYRQNTFPLISVL